MVKSSRNNEGKGPNARLCSRDGIEEEGEDGCGLFVLYRFLARTDSDSAQSLSALGLNRQWWGPAKTLLVQATNRQWCGPSLPVLAQHQSFFYFQAHNRQWRYITVGSHKSGSDEADSDVQI